MAALRAAGSDLLPPLAVLAPVDTFLPDIRDPARTDSDSSHAK